MFNISVKIIVLVLKLIYQCSTRTTPESTFLIISFLKIVKGKALKIGQLFSLRKLLKLTNPDLKDSEHWTSLGGHKHDFK